MGFIFGRNNLALTIFVPFDCNNSCRFCTSKAQYHSNKLSYHKVELAIKRFFDEYDFPIKDVVFTGGEPMANLSELKCLIKYIPDKYNIYINTTLIQRNVFDFIDFVNSCNKIKGINISRHCESYREDTVLFNDIVPDDLIDLIKKPVRINCVVGNQIILRVINRWKDKNVELCLREDFRKFQDDEHHLHNPYGDIPMILIRHGYQFHSHTQCNVCDTTRFVKDGQYVSFHKGKQYSSILKDNVLEINDLIIDQAGNFMYDWFNCDENIINELLNTYRKNIDWTTDILNSLIQKYGIDYPINRGCGSSDQGLPYCGYRGHSIGGCGARWTPSCGGGGC